MCCRRRYRAKEKKQTVENGTYASEGTAPDANRHELTEAVKATDIETGNEGMLEGWDVDKENGLAGARDGFPSFPRAGVTSTEGTCPPAEQSENATPIPVSEGLGPHSGERGIHYHALSVLPRPIPVSEPGQETGQLNTDDPVRIPSHGKVDNSQADILRLQTALSEIRKHCCAARLLEAMHQLKSLEFDLAAVTELAVANKAVANLALLSEIERMKTEVQQDAIIHRLRSIHGRLEPYLAPDGLLALAMKDDTRWVCGSSEDPRVGEKFRMDIRIRFLEGSERDPNGPTTQVVFRIDLNNWPMSFEEFVAFDRETDMIKKEWIQDCRGADGTPGGPEHLMSSMYYYIIRPALLPLGFDFLMLREYCACETSPLAGCAPGVFVVEDTPVLSGPQNSPTVSYEGFDVPAEKSGLKRIYFKTIKHFTANAGAPRCSNLTIVTKAAVNIPQWITPLSLARTIILDTTMKTFQKFKVMLVDNQENNNALQERISQAPDFYGSIRALANIPK